MSRVKNRLAGSERANPVAQVHFWKSPPGAAIEVSLIAHLDVYATIHQHCVASLPNETGGFLLGHVAYDPLRGSWHIEVDETLPVEPVSQDPVHFSFTWRDVDRVRSHRETQGKALIGWYHTHPDIGIFLSDTDLEKTHRVLFNEPFQLALVYDPVRSRAGYFFWEGVQTIDASQASWREFEIAFAEETPMPLEAEAEAEAQAEADVEAEVGVDPDTPAPQAGSAPDTVPDAPPSDAQMDEPGDGHLS